MSALGGSIESVNLDGRNFAVAADGDSDRDVGGFTNTIEPNGDGSVRQLQVRKAWKVGGLVLSIDEDTDDHKYLQDFADRKGLQKISVTYRGGVTYAGKGQLTGDLTVSSAKTTGTIELMGQKKLEKQ